MTTSLRGRENRPSQAGMAEYGEEYPQAAAMHDPKPCVALLLGYASFVAWPPTDHAKVMKEITACIVSSTRHGLQI